MKHHLQLCGHVEHVQNSAILTTFIHGLECYRYKMKNLSVSRVTIIGGVFFTGACPYLPQSHFLPGLILFIHCNVSSAGHERYTPKAHLEFPY